MPRPTSSPPRGACPRVVLATTAIALLTLASPGASASAADAAKRSIDYNRDVRPILSNTCYKCHGPDADQRKGLQKPLRLDTEEGALADLGGYAAVVPGKPDDSEALRRLTTDDENEVMPPKKSGKTLTAREVETLTEWVKQGAPFAKHWSYVAPVRPPQPEVKNPGWPRNAVDRFVLARLEKEGLAPSPEAEKTALIRRASLDLTGLPPTLDELDQFVADARPDAYERLVDRLLAKPAFGEHWGRMWLDMARYADSAGYADDPPRTIWAYRDYVVRSFNANKPFDQFTIEQLAGDLLPSPTDEQLVATAFHRNTLTNNEGGTNDEEFRNVAVVDRINTTMSVWMGTTAACAQCHDHKYDPISQKEYFSLLAFFNNTQDADRTDESPVLPIYDDAKKQKRAAVSAEIEKLEAALKTPTPEILASRSRREKGVTSSTPTEAGGASLPAVASTVRLPLPENVAAILDTAPEARTEAQRQELAKHYESIGPDLKAERDRLAGLKKELAELKPETMVPIQRELAGNARRKTRVQRRGNFLDLGDEVTEGVPAVFPPLPSGVPKDRLALARWLVDEANPLTARVLANRTWEELFGIGLVSTSEEFGAQGEPPSHPELLDWLATELVGSRWDFKRFVRLLATSAAYRQSSKVTPEMFARDPENRLLSRGPRFRLSAETIRDQALAVGGLLSPKMYGPPVRPPQPAMGLTAAFGGKTDWETSPGEDRYRRGVYTSWRRSNPYPSMATFDAPSREVCTVRRSRTNTPLQALVTLNDPVYVEAARALARRMMVDGGSTPSERVRLGLRACLARSPSEDESTRLVQLYETALASFANSTAEAEAMSGSAKGDASAVEKAAWTVVANVLLNLDEMLMKR